ncbi:SpaA isopeptide-forming pilin-related protein [Gemmiger sp.]|uniref:SpaA isopeptide-forming pilin-related protein n=1 Tax=Gemmiger sp. TaxID=2049027 RepID=UPI0025C3F3FE|nr:SpaA isopeptide-forming pilin-related protein [Gemmiger sp.]
MTPIPDGEENGESEEKFVTFAAVNAVAEGGTTYTFYFAPPTDWNLQDSDIVEFIGKRGAGDNEYDTEISRTMSRVPGYTTKDNRKIYVVSLRFKDGDKEAECTHGGYHYIKFRAKGHEIQMNGPSDNNQWLHIDAIGDHIFDADGLKDGTYPWDGSRLKLYADVAQQIPYTGQKIYFQNKTGSTLTGIQVTFYKKVDDKYEAVGETKTIEPLAAGVVSQEITIPDGPCRYVGFTDANGKPIGKTYYNFYNDDVASDYVGKFQYNAKTNDCFIYNGQSDVQWGAPNATRIYFDATFSDMSYQNDSATADGMPGNNGELYYILTGTGTDLKVLSGKMTRLEDRSESRHLWYVNVPKDYTHVQFSDTATPPTKDINGRATNTLTWGNLKEPCFYADTGDDITYGGDYRDGYWGEKSAIRDVEKGKKVNGEDAEIVKLDTGTFTPQNDVKYIDSTLYDYYSDYELNGKTRKENDYQDTRTHRAFVEFEQFNRALSDYYKDYSESVPEKKVQYPLYTGHFQPNQIDKAHFSEIAANLGLYGWGNQGKETRDLYWTFMAVNNANVDVDGKTNYNHSLDSSTFQGLVSDTRDGNHNPTLYGTDLAEPHFNEAFLTGENSAKAVLGKVYKDVAFPFKQSNVFAGTNNDAKESVAKYWYYDSSKTPLYLKQDTSEGGGYYLDSPTNEDEKKHSQNRNTVNGEEAGYGFFPFNQYVGDHVNQYNYGYGAKLQFDFTLTEDGQVVVGDENGEEKKVPIKFFFSGDDDVWVFIDDKLVLDVGGAHAKAQGLLEFGKDASGENNTVTSYVSNIKESNNKNYTKLNSPKNVTFNGTGYQFHWKSNENNQITLPKNTKHTLTMYYMERGMWESNMAVAFNFPDHNELQVEKQVDATDVCDLLKPYFTKSTRQFTVSIKNWATHYAALNQTATTDAGGSSGIGFTTKQYTIKDYGSVAAGGLKEAVGAQYTTSKDEKIHTVEDNGTFTLQNGETVTFADQFRRGSYISLQENLQEDADQKLYAPTWEIYENGKLVTQNQGDSTVEVQANAPQKMHVNGTTPDDGRKEKYKEGEEDGRKIQNTGYTAGTQKPENSIVFRSYSDPDGTDQFTKLKVKFINKVKTGSLSITKQVPDDELDTLGDKTYTFTVQYSNIGGMHLEGGEAKTETVKVKVGDPPFTLKGIPIGTEVTITEKTPENQYIKSITVNEKSVGGNEAHGTIVADTPGTDGNTVPGVRVVFTNTAHKPIAITVKKTWQDAKGEELITGLPESIWVKLQRRHKGSTSDTDWENVQDTAVELKNGTWTHTFPGMDAYDISDNNNTYYEYRVVESATGKDDYTATGGTLKLGDYNYQVYSEPKTITENVDSASLILTNTQVPPVYELAITKQGLDENGNKPKLLNGVEFKLEKLNGNEVDTTFNNNKGSMTGTTKGVGDNAGKYSFENLSEGSYRLTELKTVDGYNLLAAPIEFTLQKGECQINGTKQENMVTGTPASGYTVSLTINNRKGFTLPHTGADAPSLWLLIGLPLLVAGLLVLVFRYNRKGGKRS